MTHLGTQFKTLLPGLIGINFPRMHIENPCLLILFVNAAQTPSGDGIGIQSKKTTATARQIAAP